MPQTYRKDIQILRGLSVLLILVFHFNLGWLPNGFFGVDVFFVISGYLITRLYHKDHTAEYFRRRAKRILPAYFTTILLTLAAAVCLTLPSEFNQLVEQAWYAVFFVPNIGDFLVNTYFSKIEFNPLLHLWSLGVEIQFYLLAPLIFWLLRLHRAMFPLALLASLGACLLMITILAKASFFLIPFRLWEFLVGYGVARYYTHRGAARYPAYAWLSILLLALIVGLSMLKTGRGNGLLYGHPGIFALLVCLATGFTLSAGLPRLLERSKAGDLLELIGKYSYSIYLVHYPLIILYYYRPFSGTSLGEAEPLTTLLLLLAILGLAVLMYHFVEHPARLGAGRKYWLAAAPLTILLCLAGPQLQRSMLSPAERAITGAYQDRETIRCGQLFKLLHPFAQTCLISRKAAKPSQNILLIGDSYADAIKTAFSRQAEDMNAQVHFLVQDRMLSARGITSKQIMREVRRLKIDTIVIHFARGNVKAAKIEQLAGLAQKKKIPVAFITPVPGWSQIVPKALWNNLKHHTPLPVLTTARHLAKQRKIIARLQKIKLGNFSIYQSHRAFCSSSCRMQGKDGKPYYFDRGHLTLSGSYELQPLFKKILLDLRAWSEAHS